MATEQQIRDAFNRVKGHPTNEPAVSRDVSLLVGAVPGLLADIDARRGALRAAWSSYHALALATGTCRPTGRDTICLGCVELELLGR